MANQLLNRHFAKYLKKIVKNDRIAKKLLKLNKLAVAREDIQNVKVIRGIEGKPMFFTMGGVNTCAKKYSKVVNAIFVEQCPNYRLKVKDVEKFTNNVKFSRP